MKRLLLIALTVIGCAAIVYANTTANELATGCSYTGNSSDHCLYSDGTINWNISNCTPGSSTCGYNP